jgi:hypothetical protein
MSLDVGHFTTGWRNGIPGGSYIADKSLMIATDGSFMVELNLSYSLRRFSLSVRKGDVNWLALSPTLHALHALTEVNCLGSWRFI